MATQGIRGGDNRIVLDEICKKHNIFYAWADRNWMLDGASVHVSIIGFDDGDEQSCRLDGKVEQSINSDLTSGIDLSVALEITENRQIAYRGNQKGGAFDIDYAL